MEKNNAGELVGVRTQNQKNNDLLFKEQCIDLIQKSGENWSLNSLASLKRNAISRVLYFDKLYQSIIQIPGVIMEFGVHWGSGISLLNNLRLLYEPYNFSRNIIGFDTFEGFSGVTDIDGKGINDGQFSTQQADAEASLSKFLDYHCSISPFPEKKCYELVKGDAILTLPSWLQNNTHAAIAMAIFDMDIYKPTLDVLMAIKPRLINGSVIVFDQFNCQYFPGETQAFLDSGFNSILKLQRHPFMPYCSWGVVDLS